MSENKMRAAWRVEFLLTAEHIQFRRILSSVPPLLLLVFLTCGFTCVCVCVCVGDAGCLWTWHPQAEKNTEREEMFAVYSCRFSICKTALRTHSHTHTHISEEEQRATTLVLKHVWALRCERKTALAVIRLHALSPPHLLLRHAPQNHCTSDFLSERL